MSQRESLLRQNSRGPTELYNEDGCIMAIRIDGPEDTRGKARAFFASESGDDFTAIKVRRGAYREWTEHNEEAEADGIPEPYDGVVFDPDDARYGIGPVPAEAFDVCETTA